MSALEQAFLGGPAIEVVAKATRRRFTVEYKRKIVREADGCKTPGAVGALLRREGLYSSHLTTWRARRATRSAAQRGRADRSTPTRASRSTARGLPHRAPHRPWQSVRRYLTSGSWSCRS